MLHIHRANTILYCDRWPATVAFYRDTLQLPVNVEKSWFVEFQLAASTYLSVADAARTTIPPGHGAGLTLTWQVDDLHRLHADLQQRGLTPTPIKHKWDAHQFFIHDPENNRIELWQPDKDVSQ